MRAINPEHKPTPANEIAQLRAFMANKGAASFSDIRGAITDFSSMTDAELSQVCKDSDMRVRPD